MTIELLSLNELLSRMQEVLSISNFDGMEKRPSKSVWDRMEHDEFYIDHSQNIQSECEKAVGGMYKFYMYYSFVDGFSDGLDKILRGNFSKDYRKLYGFTVADYEELLNDLDFHFEVSLNDSDIEEEYRRLAIESGLIKEEPDDVVPFEPKEKPKKSKKKKDKKKKDKKRVIEYYAYFSVSKRQVTPSKLEVGLYDCSLAEVEEITLFLNKKYYANYDNQAKGFDISGSCLRAVSSWEDKEKEMRLHFGWDLRNEADEIMDCFKDYLKEFGKANKIKFKEIEE